MKKSSYTFIFFLFFACHQPDENKKVAVVADHIDSSKPLVNRQITKNDTPTLISVTAFHKFSDPEKNDRFSLILKGANIPTGTILFEIFDSENKIIYHENFSASDLLWGNEITNVNEQADTITARMKSFFAESNFITPARSIVPDYSEEDTDKETWAEINASTSAIGFMYTHGYEGTYGITFSEKRKKVISYFSGD